MDGIALQHLPCRYLAWHNYILGFHTPVRMWGGQEAHFLRVSTRPGTSRYGSSCH